MCRKIHVSWVIAWMCAGLLAGVALSVIVPATLFAHVGWIAAAGGLGCIAALGRTVGLVFVALAAGLLAGLWRGAGEQVRVEPYQRYYGQTVSLRGKVAEDTSFGPKGDQRLRVGSVQINSIPMHGQVWASTPSGADIKRGDFITLEGGLSKGFGNLPASMHRAALTQIERPHPGDVARRVRDWFGEGVRRAIPEPEASLGLGYLTGQRSTLPEALDEQLRVLGLTHVVVASGYNLTILVRLARRLFARFSKYLAALSATAMIVCFMAVTGLSPSMSRAGLVAGLSLAAWYYGRTIHPLVLLPFAAALTVLVNPAYMWGDIGWYLSFSSFVGVIILAPLIQHYFWGNRNKPGVLRQTLVDTMSAQAATLPIIAFVFGEYSPLALPANLLVLPFIPLAMLLTFLGGIAGVVAPGIAEWAGAPAYLILRYMTATVDWLGSLPWAHGELAFGVTQLVAGYAVLGAVILLLRRATKHDFRSESLVE